MKILFIFLILFSLSLFAQNLKKITLQLNWLNQFQFAGYYIAKEKGFYKKLGLDVEIKELNQTTDSSSSSFDFAVGRSSLIIDKINGKDVVALASIFQTSPLILLTRKDTNINSVDDLKNKRIMITSDANNTASILAMLYSRKIYMKDFIRQEHTFNLEDLITKKTDAMASYISNEPIILKEKSIEYNILDPKEYGFDFYSDILYTSSKYIKSNPTITRKFLEASLKGWYYAFENITETAEIIHNKYNSQNKTLVHLIKEGDVLKKLAFDKSDRLIGCIEKNRLLEIVNVFKVLGVVKNDMDIDSFIYEFNPHSNIVVKLTSEQKDILILIGVFSILIFIIITILLRKNQKSKDLLNTVINSTTDLIFYKDSQFNYIGCNDAFSEFVGKSKKQIIGSCDYDLFEDADAQLFRNNDIKALEDNSINIYEQKVNINGKERFLHIKKIPFQYSKKEGKGIVGISRDITQLYKINKKLKKQAYLDELTSIHNRKSYNEKVEAKLEFYKRYGVSFCLLMFDIDDFKTINDKYGHDKGDLVLKKVTKKIKSTIRESDYFFRVGGEEFIILFPEYDVDNSFLFAEKIRQEVEDLEIINGEVITISIGLVQVEKNDTIDTLFKRVDSLMYKAKQKGKNTICF